MGINKRIAMEQREYEYLMDQELSNEELDALGYFSASTENRHKTIIPSKVSEHQNELESLKTFLNTLNKL